MNVHNYSSDDFREGNVTMVVFWPALDVNKLATPSHTRITRNLNAYSSLLHTSCSSWMTWILLWSLEINIFQWRGFLSDFTFQNQFIAIASQLYFQWIVLRFILNTTSPELAMTSTDLIEVFWYVVHIVRKYICIMIYLNYPLRRYIRINAVFCQKQLPCLILLEIHHTVRYGG